MVVFLYGLFMIAVLIQNVNGQCASVLTRTEWAGQIKSPDYPSYRKGLDCRWIIMVSLGNTVNIQFSDFSMAKPGQTFADDCSDATDFVEIFDGNTTTTPLKGKFCGGKKTPVVSSSNMLLIRMKTEEENHRGFLLDFNGNCNRELTEYEGVIQTPNYPNKYPRLTTCLWKIDFGVGMDVQMEFLDFNVEDTCSYDYATVIAGGLQPKVYCGFTLPPGESVEAGGMSVGFVSDDDTELNGFAIKYKATDRNECILGHNCHSNATCSNTIGSYNCLCKASYRGDGKSCDWYREFNECLNETIHQCHEHANCVDTREEFYCQCKEGFKGDGKQCTDINECKEANDCHEKATCSNTIGSYQCQCLEVYVGDGKTCVDRDECVLGLFTCDSNAQCINTEGAYTCKCLPGFQGDGKSCYDINECLLEIDDCHPNATCLNNEGFYTCHCQTGLYGNGTSCFDFDECLYDTHRCHAQAQCINTYFHYNCKCKEGFSGDGFECIDVNECLGENECDQNATCSNTIGSYDCKCFDGFYGNGKECFDRDECFLRIDKCSVNASCVNAIGSYKCVCNQGLSGGGFTCFDINECLVPNICHPQATCKNTYSSYSCHCNDGYQGNGTHCEDINECEDEKMNVCNKDRGQCTNTEGAFKCHCLYPFIGDGINCDKMQETQYNVMMSFAGQTWNDQMLDESSEQFQNMAQIIQTQVTKLYNGDDGFLRSNITRLMFGSVRASIVIVLKLNNDILVDKMLASAVRGKLGNLNVKPNTFESTKLGFCVDDCSTNGICVTNSSGGEHCKCQEGFEGDGIVCIDTNECFVTNGGCQQKCINLIGTFSCACHQGFVLMDDQRSCKVESNQLTSSKYCAEEYTQGIEWDETVVGLTLRKICPNNENKGIAKRFCNKTSKWHSPDLTECVKEGIIQIQNRYALINTSNAIDWTSIEDILSQLVYQTDPSLFVLYAGDVLTVKDLFTDILSLFTKNQKERDFQQVKIFFNTLNTLLNHVFDRGNHKAWFGIPQGPAEMFKYMDSIQAMATLLSDFMIDQMETFSTTNPENINNYQLMDVGSEIDMKIKLLEMRRFNGIQLMQESDHNSSKFSVIYSNQIFKEQVMDLLKQKGSYKPIGCWADYNRHAADVSLETKHSTLQDNYLIRTDAIEKCGAVAYDEKFNVFALHDGGACAAGPLLHQTYKQDGKASNCAFGKGGAFANDMYEITKFYTGILTISFYQVGHLMKQLLPDSTFPPSASTNTHYGELITTSILKYPLFKHSGDNKGQVRIKPTQKNAYIHGITCFKVSYTNGSIEVQDETCETRKVDGIVECVCQTMAHYFIVYNYTNVKPVAQAVKEDVYNVLIYISYGINCFCIIWSLLIHFYHKTNQASILLHSNLSFVILCTETIYVFGISTDINFDKVHCKWIMIAFQFFLASLFTWFLTLSWQSYHRLNDVIKQTYRRRRGTYILFGYGYAVLLTLISMAIFYKDFGNLSHGMCWMSRTILISVFIPPIALLIMFCVVMLGMVIGIYFSPRSSQSLPDSKTMELEKEEIYSVRDNVRATAIMLPICMLTWLFAILRVTENDDFTKYMFFFFNTIQGIAFLTVYCFLNKELAQYYLESAETTHITSPPLATINMFKATAYNGNNFKSKRTAIPAEVMYELKQQTARQ